ncbi:AAA family ATPase [uncultured Neglectibacter sp.]|uniref:phosphotransferase-like protein n=1 Tax=uncultured Neglectibacter sp. TaxID=1924108 RepID=UPI0034DEEDCE
MIVLLAGASHTGKTALAQRLLEKYGFPYLSIDHLKMGLIRSGLTSLTPEDDDKLTAYLWPVLREIVKTAVENGQNLIIEGCYIPFDWQKDFTEDYLRQIRYFCLVMTESYIKAHFQDIRTYESVIENRPDDPSFSLENVLLENRQNLELCRKYGYKPVLIDKSYQVEIEL